MRLGRSLQRWKALICLMINGLKAAEAVGAVSGNTYVQLNRGLLTVDQINYFLDSMPMELTFADSNNQFLYYNLRQEAHEMLAARVPGQVGNPLANCHPEKSYKNVEWVIQHSSGATDSVRVHVPKQVPEKYIVHNYQAMHDENGEYAGINEYILDFKPIIEWYLQQTGQNWWETKMLSLALLFTRTQMLLPVLLSTKITQSQLRQLVRQRLS